MEKITCTIDNREVSVEAGITILEAAKSIGIGIPTFCNNELLKPFSSCFVCVVEVEGGRGNLIPSCSTSVRDGMVIRTDTERVSKARRTCVELLLSDHEGDCLGPCMSSCPAGIDIPGFVKHIADGNDGEALNLIRLSMPLPGILGRICTRPCEEACRRQLVEEEISICGLKRFPADEERKSGKPDLPEPAAPSGKTVAVVGAGPAGLSAAWFLQLAGHSCTVFDAHEAPGGMTRYGIPSYRLPRDVIDYEAGLVEKLGANFRYSTKFGIDITLEDLRSEFDAVFLAIGAQNASSMRVDGEDCAGVLTGIEFLAAASRDESMAVGRSVVVVGGGNTAIDAARTARRLGAEEVSVLYRRTRKEMPAWDVEIEAALEEGVELELLAAPTGIKEDGDGRLTVSCIRMELGEPDASGRRRPVPVAGSEYTKAVDNVIAAIGQLVDASSVHEIKHDRWGTIVADEHSGATALAGVFAGGDCVTGADIAVSAVAAGRRTAIAIDQFLSGMDITGPVREYNHSMGPLDSISPKVTADREVEYKVPGPELDPGVRASSFDEVETGYTAESARAEAERCLECGCRQASDCKLRGYATDFGAVAGHFDGVKRSYDRDASHESVVYESHKCIQCGTCVRITREVIGSDAMGFVGRGIGARVQPALARKLAEVDATRIDEIVDNCPVGALTFKSAPVNTLKG